MNLFKQDKLALGKLKPPYLPDAKNMNDNVTINKAFKEGVTSISVVK